MHDQNVEGSAPHRQPLYTASRVSLYYRLCIWTVNTFPGPSDQRKMRLSCDGPEGQPPLIESDSQIVRIVVRRIGGDVGHLGCIGVH